MLQNFTITSLCPTFILRLTQKVFIVQKIVPLLLLDISDSLEIINEYKEQVRILKQEVAELQDSSKSKDSANKRCLQKLEHLSKDLEDANKTIEDLKETEKILENEPLPRRVIAAGLHAGLTVALNVEKDEYYCSGSESVGFKVSNNQNFVKVS